MTALAVYLTEIKLDNEGYDDQGSYWGTKGKLFYFELPDEIKDPNTVARRGTFWANNKAAAKEHVREQLGNVRFVG